MAEDWEAGGFGLYLHWPFCQAKCPYCDFNSHVVAHVDQSRWAAAFEAEIARAAAETGPRLLRSVFFGGGTPSLMAPGTVDRVMRAVRAAWPASNDLEVTLEANPTSVEAERFAGYAEAGVNRVSMGIQALDDADLRRLGRLHSVAEAERAFAIAREQFGRVSFDLIYARQDQTAEGWRAELDRALGMAVDHLSLYQLTIEDGTAFAERLKAGGLRGLPDEDRAADLWDVTQEVAAAHGLPAYEVSNHARPGAESRHNLVYWRSGDWVGIGPGAHGRLTLDGKRWATETPKAPGAWLERVEERGTGETGRAALTGDERRAELLLMGLRLAEGVDLARVGPLDENLSSNISYLEDIGLMDRTGGRLVVTPKGRPLLDAVLRRLFAD